MADVHLRRRTIRMSDELYDELGRMAAEEIPPTNISELVRIAVEDMLRERGRWDERFRAGDPARQARYAPSRAAQ